MLQPLDLSVNKPIKDSLKSKFQSWYAGNVTQSSLLIYAFETVYTTLHFDHPLIHAVERG